MKQRMKQKNIAVTGIAAQVGACEDVDALARALYDGTPIAAPREGALVDSMDRVIERALADAGLSREDVDVIVVGDAASPTVFEAISDVGRSIPTPMVIAAGDATGAGAIVLCDLAQAEAQFERIYAVLDGLALAQDRANSPETVAATCRRAWAQADVAPPAIGYLEMCGVATVPAGLARAYRASTSDLTCALGITPGGAEMISLIKTILCVHQRFLPPLPDGVAPFASDPQGDAPFYVDGAARPWFVPAEAGKRTAALHAAREDGAHAHLIVSEVASQPWRRDSRYLQHVEGYLLPIAGEEQAALLAQLRRVQGWITAARTSTELHAAARRAFEVYISREDARYALSLVGRDREELLREIERAFEGVAEAFQQQKTWQTPRGSYFTPQPLGKEGAVAFVYPGAFNAYPNLGRDLFQLFPGLHERFGALAPDVGGALRERWIYPRHRTKPDRRAQRADMAALMRQPAALIEAGTSFAVLFTVIMRDYFGVRAEAALGYSLGEASMLWASGVWTDAEAGSRSWRESALFQTRLAGPKAAVREQWRVGPEVADDALWHSYLLKAPVAEIRARVADEPRVYLTMINTPGEGIIAGDPAGCRRVIEALACHALPVPYDAVIHAAPIMRADHADFVYLYIHPVEAQPEITFYSAADCASLALTSDKLAHALADMTCSPIDFPRLIHRAYDDGARIFIELGPQHTCTRWIDKILADQPHAAMAIDKKRGDDIVAIFGVLARLLSHRVDVDLAPLYAPAEVGRDGIPTDQKVAPTGEAATANDEPSATVSVPVAGRGEWTAPSRAMGAARTWGVAEMHAVFLHMRHTALCETSALIQTQIAAYDQWLHPGKISALFVSASSAQSAALFDLADLEAFASGSIAACFGSDYDRFEHRRMPRIPNGDLLLISRILEIEGEAGEVQTGAELVSEYDVPADAWFYRRNAHTPYAILMEIAMQPCGFLSAYLGSALLYPDTDFYFRNLDGVGRLLADPDLRGRTVTNRVRLTSSTTVRGVILQQFDFALACEGETFYEGEATFGYFERGALVNQVGLDGGASPPPWLWQSAAAGAPVDVVDLTSAGAQGQLEFLDVVRVVEDGGRFGQGYVQAEMTVAPEDWFFACHFYQDPVMPGSLGVAAIQQAMQVYALRQGLGSHLDAPRFASIAPHQTTWKYRGQITPQDAGATLEVHVREIETGAQRVTLVGEASLWKGDRRIYEITDVGICLQATAPDYSTQNYAPIRLKTI